MKELNEKEWKELHDQVKEKDKLQEKDLGVNLFVVGIIIDTKKDYSDVLFDEKG